MTFNGTAALVTQRSLCTGTTFAIAAEAGIRRSDGGLLADGLRFLTAFGMTLALSCSRTRASRGAGKWVPVCTGTTFATEAGIRPVSDGLRFLTAFDIGAVMLASAGPEGVGKWVPVCTGTTFAIAAEAGIRRSDGGLLADGLRFFTAFRMTLALSCSRALASRWRGEVGFRPRVGVRGKLSRERRLPLLRKQVLGGGVGFRLYGRDRGRMGT